MPQEPVEWHHSLVANGKAGVRLTTNYAVDCQIPDNSWSAPRRMSNKTELRPWLISCFVYMFHPVTFDSRMPPSLSLLEGLVSPVFIRLTCKLANILNGLNVTNDHVGDVLEVTEAEGFMLLAEGWGERVSDQTATELSAESDSEERLQA